MPTSKEAEKGVPYVDIGVVVGIPAALAALYFFLPTPIQETLVFEFHDPRVWTAWTAAFIHLNESHLLSNVLGYAVAVIPAYTLFHRMGQRRQFWIAAGLIFVLTPFVTTAFGYWLLHLRWGVMAEGATSRGFSGVVTALAGMLLAILTLFLAAEYDKYRAGNAAVVTVLLGLGLVAAELDALTPVRVALLTIGLLTCLSGFVSRSLLLDWSRWPTLWTRNSENLVYTIYSGVVVCLFMLTFIPATSDEGMFSNAIAHATGFTVGLVLTFVVSLED
jgi:membrane associated rhomboid family serine protease